jgi:hypothetical protein
VVCCGVSGVFGVMCGGIQVSNGILQVQMEQHSKLGGIPIRARMVESRQWYGSQFLPCLCYHPTTLHPVYPQIPVVHIVVQCQPYRQQVSLTHSSRTPEHTATLLNLPTVPLHPFTAISGSKSFSTGYCSFASGAIARYLQQLPTVINFHGPPGGLARFSFSHVIVGALGFQAYCGLHSTGAVAVC